jgi:membrane protease YdiL (CAAX protease family)
MLSHLIIDIRLVGIATLAVYQYCRRRQQQQQQHQQQREDTTTTTKQSSAISPESAGATAETNAHQIGILPSLLRAPNSEDELPWKGVYSSKYSAWTSFGTFWILLWVWRQVGNWSVSIEDILYELAAGENALLPITVPMHRSLSVLLGHLSWILAGSMVLRWFPRPQPFFQQQRRHQQEPRQSSRSTVEKPSTAMEESTTSNGSMSSNTTTATLQSSSSSATLSATSSTMTLPLKSSLASKWLRNRFRQTNFLWWSIGGYFVSSWLFNIADFLNAYILPTKFLELAADSSIVSQLINPEGQDWLASVVGFIAPCVTAPWFEEILYRGFLLPALTLWIPVLLPIGVSGGSPSDSAESSLKLEWTYYWSIFWSGVLFSLHHVSLTSFVPLCVLGWVWAVIYTKSQNLWTTVVIHAMWNSRIFLGSWL